MLQAQAACSSAGDHDAPQPLRALLAPAFPHWAPVPLTQVSSALFEPPAFQPSKLSVEFLAGADARGPTPPFARRYTLTHNDLTGALRLSIGAQFNARQVRNLYTRVLRDEIVSEWRFGGGAAPWGGACEARHPPRSTAPRATAGSRVLQSVRGQDSASQCSRPRRRAGGVQVCPGGVRGVYHLEPHNAARAPQRPAMPCGSCPAAAHEQNRAPLFPAHPPWLLNMQAFMLPCTSCLSTPPLGIARKAYSRVQMRMKAHALVVCLVAAARAAQRPNP